MASTDDQRSRDRDRASGEWRRRSGRKAEPTPLTEAMIKPGSDRRRSHKAVADGPRFCRSCGERNVSGGTYCLSCGISFRPRESVSRARAGAGATDSARRHPVASMTKAAPSGGTDHKSRTDQSPPGSTRGRLLTLVAVIAVIASLVLGFRTLQSRDSVTATPADTVVSTAIVTTVDTAAMPLYVDQISMLGADVAQIVETSRHINDEWDERTADYQPTKDRMRALVSRASVLPARMAQITVPVMADPLAHRRMLLEIATLVSAAEGMMAGLESTDAGETRISELVRFEASAREFLALVDQVERSVASGLGLGGTA